MLHPPGPSRVVGPVGSCVRRTLVIVGPMGELGALFNPGMRHEIEERQSKAVRREEEGNARDGDQQIDLDSGVAVIDLSGRAEREREASALARARSAAKRAEVLRRKAERKANSAARQSTPAPDQTALTTASNSRAAGAHRSARQMPQNKAHRAAN